MAAKKCIKSSVHDYGKEKRIPVSKASLKEGLNADINFDDDLKKINLINFVDILISWSARDLGGKNDNA